MKQAKKKASETSTAKQKLKVPAGQLADVKAGASDKKPKKKTEESRPHYSQRDSNGNV